MMVLKTGVNMSTDNENLPYSEVRRIAKEFGFSSSEVSAKTQVMIDSFARAIEKAVIENTCSEIYDLKAEIAGLLQVQADLMHDNNRLSAKREMLTAGYCVPSASDPRNFPEDYQHENGCYSNLCAVCANEFIGYKRRRVCKVCLEANGKQDRKPLPREEVDNILESLGFVEHQERADFINGFRNAELAHGIGDKS